MLSPSEADTPASLPSHLTPPRLLHNWRRRQAVEGPDFWLKRSHTYQAREVQEPEYTTCVTPPRPLPPYAPPLPQPNPQPLVQALIFLTSGAQRAVDAVAYIR